MYINSVVNTGTCVCIYISIHVFANSVQVHKKCTNTSLDYWWLCTLMRSKSSIINPHCHWAVQCKDQVLIHVSGSLCRSAEERYGGRSRDMSEVKFDAYFTCTYTCVYNMLAFTSKAHVACVVSLKVEAAWFFLLVLCCFVLLGLYTSTVKPAFSHLWALKKWPL